MSHTTNAFNLAYRHSVKNEHDLLRKLYPDHACVACFRSLVSSLTNSHRHSIPFCIAEEDILERDPFDSPITEKQCLSMVAMVCPDSPLPAGCNQFEEIKIAMQRKNSNRSSHAIAFRGMSAGEATAAMAARERGQLNHAQIQHRLTASKKRTLW
jgi:hypothetical protein